MPFSEKGQFHKLSSNAKPVLVIHGGAGIMDKKSITEPQQKLYKHALEQSLLAGYNVLQEGGEAIDAATAAVAVMEDCPLFNSGKGAVFNRGGKNELEASIMLSKPPSYGSNIPPTRRGISATLLTRTRNPSRLVRALYLAPDNAPHAFLSGAEVERIGSEELGQILVDPSYFFTEKRWREHRRGLGLPEEPLPYPADKSSGDFDMEFDNLPKGTVGAVALDANGCIAVVTSTGGKTNKTVGRVGDTPVMGAGFWAEEWNTTNFWEKLLTKLSKKNKKRAVGISGTGDGDYFIRYNTAATVAALMKFKHKKLSSAADWVIEDLRKHDGSGGLIALDGRGNVALPLNSSGMFRGVIRADGQPKTAIFDDDVLT